VQSTIKPGELHRVQLDGHPRLVRTVRCQDQAAELTWICRDVRSGKEIIVRADVIQPLVNESPGGGS